MHLADDGLTEREVAYLVETEWARSAEDIIWRRSKLGLRLSPVQIEAVDGAIQAMLGDRVGAG